MTDRAVVQIVEPTLSSQAGHCSALYRSLSGAAPDLRFRLWIDRAARLDELHLEHAELTPYFSRRWRKLQAIWLYRKLLRSGLPVYVPTASYFDLRACDLAAGEPVAANKAFFYFHKLRISPARQQALQRLAQRQPQWQLFGTSEEIVDRLRQAGFTHVQRIVPVLDDVPSSAAPTAFRHLLFAGAARADKGFSTVVDLAQCMVDTGTHLPTLIQTSGDHYGRYDDQTRRDLIRLDQIHLPGLTTVADTLSVDTYRAQFPGSICLQAYSPAEYGDKMSAVIFDALKAGAPIVTLAGTSMAPIVADSGAGLVLPDTNPQRWLEAVVEIRANYAGYQAKALIAASRYQSSEVWKPLASGLRAGLTDVA
jgi:hypothetical protein